MESEARRHHERHRRALLPVSARTPSARQGFGMTLRARDLRVQYETRAVLAGVDVELRDGELVLLAGRPPDQEQEGMLIQAGVDGFLHRGCDLLAALDELLDDLADELRACCR